MSKKKFGFCLKFLILPILLWSLFTPWSSELDLKIAHYFYETGGFHSPHSFWDFIYQFGILPGWMLVFLACAGYVCSFRSSLYSWRKPCLLIILTLAIGSGVIIHSIFKENWGRPRPLQVIEFGGKQFFRSYYEPNFNHQLERSKSFTSGHSSMGFVFFSLALAGMHLKRKKVFWTGMVLAWGFGTILSLGRIARGGHFLSDTLASGLIMWLTASTIYYFFFIKNENKDEEVNT